MKVTTLSNRRVLAPCRLAWYTYQIDPYIGCEHSCLYCYILNTPHRNEHILIHKNITKRLHQEILSLKPQTIYMGMDTDPYQPLEKTLNQTRTVLQLLAEKEFSVSLLTKSPLITRDIDILTRMEDPLAGISLAFQDEETRKLFEPKAPPNEQRIRALAELKKAGIETYTLICPVIPKITDVEALIDKAVPYSDAIWLYRLNVHSKNVNWQNVNSILHRNFPEIAEQVREIIFSRKHAYWTEVRQNLVNIQKERGISLEIRL